MIITVNNNNCVIEYNLLFVNTCKSIIQEYSITIEFELEWWIRMNNNGPNRSGLYIIHVHVRM